MKLIIPLLVVFPWLAAGCTNITSAPEGSPRVEVELFVDVDDAVFAPFDPSVDREELVALLQEAAQPMADVGLRFYPVPTGVYGEDDERPEYALKIRVERFDVAFDHKMIEEEGKEPVIETDVDSAESGVSAVFEKRRPQAPALMVGTEKATGHVSIRADDAGDLMLAHVPEDGERLYLSKAAFVETVGEAIERVLARLQEPIDREFEPKPGG